MKIIIDIPKEFERHFEVDRFEDSLRRLSVDAYSMAGLYEQETAVMLIQAFKHAVCIPSYGKLIDANELLKDLESREWFEEADMFIAKRAVSTVLPIIRVDQDEKEETKDDAYGLVTEAADTIEKLTKLVDSLMDCIYKAKDALDRGTDNDLARSALEKAYEVERSVHNGA